MNALLRQIPFTDLQARLPVLAAAQKPAARPAGGWLRAVRQTVGLAQTDVAKNVGVTKQAYAQFEHGETKGTLSLGSLQRAAGAMDCDLVYYLVPRAKLVGEHSAPSVAHLPAGRNAIAPKGPDANELPTHLL